MQMIEERDAYQEAIDDGTQDAQIELARWEDASRTEMAEHRRARLFQEACHRAILGEKSVIPHPREVVEMERQASYGRDIAEREDAEIDDMHIAPAIDYFLDNVRSVRAGERAAAGALLASLRACGCDVRLLHGSVRVSPPDRIPAGAMRSIIELQGPLGDLIDDETTPEPYLSRA